MLLSGAAARAPDLLPSGDIDAASLVNSRPEKPRVSPVAVASAHAVLAEAKRQRAVRDKQRKNRRGKKKPVTAARDGCRQGAVVTRHLGPRRPRPRNVQNKPRPPPQMNHAASATSAPK